LSVLNVKYLLGDGDATWEFRGTPHVHVDDLLVLRSWVRSNLAHEWEAVFEAVDLFGSDILSLILDRAYKVVTELGVFW
jgi:hypothetical protein